MGKVGDRDSAGRRTLDGLQASTPTSNYGRKSAAGRREKTDAYQSSGQRACDQAQHSTTPDHRSPTDLSPRAPPLVAAVNSLEGSPVDVMESILDKLDVLSLVRVARASRTMGRRVGASAAADRHLTCFLAAHDSDRHPWPALTPRPDQSALIVILTLGYLASSIKVLALSQPWPLNVVPWCMMVAAVPLSYVSIHVLRGGTNPRFKVSRDDGECTLGRLVRRVGPALAACDMVNDGPQDMSLALQAAVCCLPCRPTLDGLPLRHERVLSLTAIAVVSDTLVSENRYAQIPLEPETLLSRRLQASFRLRGMQNTRLSPREQSQSWRPMVGSALGSCLAKHLHVSSGYLGIILRQASSVADQDAATVMLERLEGWLDLLGVLAGNKINNTTSSLTSALLDERAGAGWREKFPCTALALDP